MDLELGLNLGRQIVQMAPVVPAVVPHQHPDPVAIADQSFGQVTADEPPCPGHQDRLTHDLAAPCDDFSPPVRATPRCQSYGFFRSLTTRKLASACPSNSPQNATRTGRLILSESSEGPDDLLFPHIPLSF